MVGVAFEVARGDSHVIVLVRLQIAYGEFVAFGLEVGDLVARQDGGKLVVAPLDCLCLKTYKVAT